MNLPSYGESIVYLQPRPLALSSGKLLLLPLLPRRRPLKSLPCELWTHIFELAVAGYGEQEPHVAAHLKTSLLLVCKTLKVRTNQGPCMARELHTTLILVTAGGRATYILFSHSSHPAIVAAEFHGSTDRGGPKMGFHPTNTLVRAWSLGPLIGPLRFAAGCRGRDLSD